MHTVPSGIFWNGFFHWMNIAWEFLHILKILQEHGFNSLTEFTGINPILLDQVPEASHWQGGGGGCWSPDQVSGTGAPWEVSDLLWGQLWAPSSDFCMWVVPPVHSHCDLSLENFMIICLWAWTSSHLNRPFPCTPPKPSNHSCPGSFSGGLCVADFPCLLPLFLDIIFSPAVGSDCLEYSIRGEFSFQPSDLEI